MQYVFISSIIKNNNKNFSSIYFISIKIQNYYYDYGFKISKIILNATLDWLKQPLYFVLHYFIAIRRKTIIRTMKHGFLNPEVGFVPKTKKKYG
jgi:hypothetical protein